MNNIDKGSGLALILVLIVSLIIAFLVVLPAHGFCFWWMLESIYSYHKESGL